MNESASQRVNEPPSNFSFLISNLPQTLLIFLVVVFALYFSSLSLQQHWAFQTNGMDVGNVDQALWNTARGRFLQFTLMTPVESRLALHVEPVLLLLVPFYWLGLGGPELLLVVQAGVVALGAWPLYQLSIIKFQFSRADQSLRGHVKGRSNLPLLAFPLAYLLWPGLESAVLFEFHAVTLAPTFLLFAFLALEQKHDSRFLIFALLAMACKEDMPLVVAMLGLYAGLARRRWRLASVTIGLSALWFALAFFVIQPQFAAGGNIQLDRYAWLGANPAAMLQTIVTQPAQVAAHLQEANLFGYLFSLFFPTAFLALLSPLTLLPMLPTLAVNLLSANPFQWRLEDFHYAAPLAPFLFVSAIYGIKRVSESANQRFNQPTNQPSPVFAILTVLLLIFSVIYHILRGYTPLARPFAWPAVTAHHRQLEQVVATIPPDSALFTQANLAPHLSRRQTIYTDFAYFTDPNFPGGPVGDILLDVTAFENIGGLHQFLADTLLTSGHYRLITATDGILHFQSQTAPPTPASQLPAPFYTFTRPDALPQYPVTVDFGDMLRLRGYTLYFDRQEEVQVSVDLEPLQPLPADVQPVLYLLDDTGQPLGATTDLQPALVWYPAKQWPVGEVVRVRFNTLPWHTRDRQQYRLALGIISGNDPWAGPQRYPPVIVQAEALAPRLPGAGTLLELARLEQTWQMPYGGPLARQFKIPSSASSLTANFDNKISLMGINSSPPLRCAAGAIVDTRHSSLVVTLTWQALTTPPDLTRFVQLVGPDGRVTSQDDAAPDNEQYPTRLWQPGEVVVETVSLPLPPDRLPGPYTLHLGLYRPDTGARLSLVSGGDHVEVELGRLGD